MLILSKVPITKSSLHLQEAKQRALIKESALLLENVNYKDLMFRVN